MNLDILDSWNIREIKNLMYVDTRGVEGPSNLQNTILKNNLQCQNRGGRGV
jgi:hypothetical protein